ncbi:MAG: inositol monophosphatase [Rhodospirillales bacterium]|nr:inositol monophosphatase [Rhodospirillales bacterium]
MSYPEIPFADVEDLIRETAELDILPHFRNLSESQVQEKSPGDVVTVADMAAEFRLSKGLSKMLPGSNIVGEEMTYKDEDVLKRFEGDAPVWVIDPLDGTGNFANGNPAFAVMVSLIVRGRTCAGWIFDPLGERMAVGEIGGGSQLNGERLDIAKAPAPEKMHGGILTKFLPDDLRDTAESSKALFSEISATMCAGHEYLSMLNGDKHFVLYYRTLPWDHAAGSLLYQEAGGYAVRLDGSVFQPTDGRFGLLEATDPDTWRIVHDLVVPSVSLIEMA